jgi:hypothetical protein
VGVQVPLSAPNIWLSYVNRYGFLKIIGGIKPTEPHDLEEIVRNIVFDGNGTYTLTAKAADAAENTVTSITGSGAYTIASSGYGYMSTPLQFVYSQFEEVFVVEIGVRAARHVWHLGVSGIGDEAAARWAHSVIPLMRV